MKLYFGKLYNWEANVVTRILMTAVNERAARAALEDHAVATRNKVECVWFICDTPEEDVWEELA